MTTTPEQLQAWREEAEKAWEIDPSTQIREGSYAAYIKGYLRRCQETEQALKDARKQALEEAIAVVQVYEACGSNVASVAVRINNELKGLLK